jgi:ABC-type uncharacterized transport system permease subunit
MILEYKTLDFDMGKLSELAKQGYTLMQVVPVGLRFNNRTGWRIESVMVLCRETDKAPRKAKA